MISAWGSEASTGRGKTKWLRAAAWNRDLGGIESPAAGVESFSRDFEPARGQAHGENSPRRSGLVSRAPSAERRRLLSGL
jgi:hypothetical protein